MLALSLHSKRAHGQSNRRVWSDIEQEPGSEGRDQRVTSESRAALEKTAWFERLLASDG